MKPVKKVLTLSEFRKLENDVNQGVITLSRMVEIINHLAYFEYNIEPYQKDHWHENEGWKASIESKSDHVRNLIRWDSKTYESDFDKGMSKPNPPGYFSANNN